MMINFQIRKVNDYEYDHYMILFGLYKHTTMDSSFFSLYKETSTLKLTPERKIRKIACHGTHITTELLGF
jgi:hypothetical protein